MAKGFLIKDTTRLTPEAREIRGYPSYWNKKLINYVFIKTDSSSMVQILEKKWDTPWSITVEVKKKSSQMSYQKVYNTFFEKEILLLIFLLICLLFFTSKYQLNNY